MRTVTLISAILISNAIRHVEYEPIVYRFFVVVLVCLISMDVIEFFHKLGK